MARKRVMKGGFFSKVFKKFQKDRIADCKDWVKKQQKKRKMKGKGSQTGSGGAYALNKLVGRGYRDNLQKIIGRGKRKNQRKKRVGKKR